MGRTLDRLHRTEQTLRRARSIRLDVTDEKQIHEAFRAASDSFGPIDVLVNNAGIAASAPFARSSRAMLQSILDVNLFGSYLCAQVVVDGMRERDWGRIVNVASTAGLTGYPYISAYCASKHAVVGFTRALAMELAGTGVTVNAVCPGYTATDMLEESLRNIVEKTGRSRDEAEQILLAQNPQKRFVQPEEVAETVFWLCQPGSGSVTGQSIVVAGGEVM
jgi:NAD(P)-dependent dehydrogenase (short-subunit alcohol dehydrogenase family)